MNSQHVPLRALLSPAPRFRVQPYYVPFQVRQPSTIQERNAEKLRAAIEWLGERWILHPKHSAKRKAGA
jgi:hypothetical protein